MKSSAKLLLASQIFLMAPAMNADVIYEGESIEGGFVCTSDTSYGCKFDNTRFGFSVYVPKHTILLTPENGDGAILKIDELAGKYDLRVSASHDVGIEIEDTMYGPKNTWPISGPNWAGEVTVSATDYKTYVQMKVKKFGVDYSVYFEGESEHFLENSVVIFKLINSWSLGVG